MGLFSMKETRRRELGVGSRRRRALLHALLWNKGKGRNIDNTPLTMIAILPYSVETMMVELAQKNGIQPANEDARKALAELGEESALYILKKMSRTSKIRSLSRLIKHMIKNESIPASVVSCTSNYESPTSLTRSRVNSYVSSLADGVAEAATPRCPSDDGFYPISGERRQTYADELDSIRRKSKLPIFTEHLKALGKLDFPKAFLVLSYVSQYVLEEVLSVQDIHNLQGLEIADIKSKLKQAVTMKSDTNFYFEEKQYEWNPNKPHKYHCYVDCEGNYVFKGPFSVGTTTHLQRVLGDSNVLQVHFAEGMLSEYREPNRKVQDRPSKPNKEQRERLHKIAKEGIFVGLRRYQFFVFKDNGKEKKKIAMSSSVKCYFVCTQSFAEADRNSSYILFNKSIHEARCMFMHVHTVSSLKKYMARFSLVLSKTICFEGDMSNVEIKHIKDIPCMDEEMNEAYDINGESLIQTDGTGFISEDLASQCPMNIYEGKQFNEDSKVCPLLIQCRLFNNGYAVKGTLLVNRELPCKSIHIRDSMIKVKRDESLVCFQTINSLEICKSSCKPNTSNLSRYLIALLNYGGVPNDFFIRLVNEAFDRIQNEFRDRRKAYKVVKQHKHLDETHMALRMLSCGIPLDEPLLQYQLKQYMLEEIKMFKEGKVRLDESFYLMGTADPTGKLKSNEVCVLLDHGQVSGKVLVYRNPGLHFGDIHVLKATYIKDIEKIVGDSKYAIFFSTQGPRSAANEIADGDFDGDLYWVSMNATLLKHFKPGTAWERPIQDKGMPQPRPTDFSYEELEEMLIEEFFNLRFEPSNEISVAADSWLVFMDRLLTPRVRDPNEHQTLKEKMLRLTNIYYEALDAPKSGKKVKVPKALRPKKRPHFLNKNPQNENLERFYISSSVLGEIYDMSLSDFGSQSDEIWTIPCLQDANVGDCKAKWEDHYTRYRSEMSEALKPANRSKSSSNPNKIIQDYKKILYDATSLGASLKPKEQIHLEASALYQVVYEHAKKVKQVKKCAFAWKVAGEALCDMYLRNHDEESILISPSILYENIY